MSDEAWVYKTLKKDYKHESVNHAKEEYVRGVFHTNTIEGFLACSSVVSLVSITKYQQSIYIATVTSFRGVTVTVRQRR